MTWLLVRLSTEWTTVYQVQVVQRTGKTFQSMHAKPPKYMLILKLIKYVVYVQNYSGRQCRYMNIQKLEEIAFSQFLFLPKSLYLDRKQL